jgi:hypothetical protein
MTGAITCERPCREAIAGQGDRAYELVQSLQPARAEPLSACRGEAIVFLAELGLACGRFTPERGVEALRLAPRARVMEPLSRVEARLHVHRLLLEGAAEHEAARAVEARQRRILALLSTPGGARAEDLWSSARAVAPTDPWARRHGPLDDLEDWGPYEHTDDDDDAPRPTPEQLRAQVEELVRAGLDEHAAELLVRPN